MEAAKKIAQQLRLRDIGGIIIIDFIDMEDKKNEDLVVETLREALKNDRTKTNVIGFTRIGAGRDDAQKSAPPCFCVVADALCRLRGQRQGNGPGSDSYSHLQRGESTGTQHGSG